VLETDCTRTDTGDGVGATTRRSAAARKVASGDVICEECGETNKPGSEFCVFCGAYLGWQAKQNAVGVNEVTHPLPSQSAAPATEPAPSRAAAAAGSQPLTQSQPQPTPRIAAPRESAGAGPLAAATPAAQAQSNPAQPMTTTMAAPAPTASVVPSCPACGRPIEGRRRFCAHCGHQLIGPGSGAGAALRRPPAKRDTWWTRLWDSKDRVARRAYRRSLPPLYRWRRVIIILLALGLIGGGATLIGHSPKAFVLARYYDLKKSLVTVAPVTPTTIPPDASAPGTQPGSLVDNSAAAWQMNWSDTTQGSPCGVAPTTPVIELSFPRTRIRRIDLRAGLLDNNTYRVKQFRPKDIWIAYADQCVPFSLADVEFQQVPLDTKKAVTSLRIGVKTAYPPAQPADAQPLLAFTEITLKARPPTR
jgi:uncharacterized OB-fold protein